MQDYNIASTEKRTGAFVIDDIIISLFFLIIFYPQLAELFGNITVIDQAVIESMNNFISQNILVLFGIKLIYHTILIWQNGMTIGKYIMKIRAIENNSNENLTLNKAFLRAFIRIFSELFFYIGFIFAFFTPLKQTLHDKLTNTIIIVNE